MNKNSGGVQGVKTAYSTYSSDIWAVFKSLYPAKTESEFGSFCNRVYDRSLRAVSEGQSIETCDPDLVAAVAGCLFLWKFRSIEHFFLAPGVAEFCASSVKEFSHDYCKRLPACKSVNGPGQTTQTQQGGFAIHFPAKERQRSVMVIPDALLPTWGNDQAHAFKRYYFVANDSEDTVFMQQSTPDEIFNGEPQQAWLAKLVFGLSLYMDAFPDAVVEAGAENIHQIKHYDGARHIVNRNEIIDEEQKHSVSPHWRRGHFRLLASAKFVRKQGQTVYVRGTFVKGKAFDVMDDTPSGAANNNLRGR